MILTHLGVHGICVYICMFLYRCNYMVTDAPWRLNNNFLFGSHRKTSCDMDPANCSVARDDVCIVFVGNNYTAP